jgi:hypothetical protein
VDDDVRIGRGHCGLQRRRVGHVADHDC